MTAKLALRVHPGARRNGIRGWLEDGTLKLEVTAAPEDGRANRAVCELIAEALGIRKQQVSVTRGSSSRTKQVEIEGVEPGRIRPRLEARLKERE